MKTRDSVAPVSPGIGMRPTAVEDWRPISDLSSPLGGTPKGILRRASSSDQGKLPSAPLLQEVTIPQVSPIVTNAGLLTADPRMLQAKTEPPKLDVKTDLPAIKQVSACARAIIYPSS